MTNEEIVLSMGYTKEDEILLFSSPSFEGALIGVENGRAVYNYDLMVEALAYEYRADDSIEEDEYDPDRILMAMEFIDYNTIRSLPYYPNSPIVKYFDEDGNEQIVEEE